MILSKLSSSFLSSISIFLLKGVPSLFDKVARDAERMKSLSMHQAEVLQHTSQKVEETFLKKLWHLNFDLRKSNIKQKEG